MGEVQPGGRPEISALSFMWYPTNLITAGEDFSLSPADDLLMKQLNSVAVQPASDGLVLWGMDMATFHDRQSAAELEALAIADAAYWPSDDDPIYQAMALRAGVAVRESGLAHRITTNQVVAANHPGRFLLPIPEVRKAILFDPEHRQRTAQMIGETAWKSIFQEYVGNASLAAIARFAVAPFTSRRTSMAT